MWNGGARVVMPLAASRSGRCGGAQPTLTPPPLQNGRGERPTHHVHGTDELQNWSTVYHASTPRLATISHAPPVEHKRCPSPNNQTKDR